MSWPDLTHLHVIVTQPRIKSNLFLQPRNAAWLHRTTVISFVIWKLQTLMLLVTGESKNITVTSYFPTLRISCSLWTIVILNNRNYAKKNNPVLHRAVLSAKQALYWDYIILIHLFSFFYLVFYMLYLYRFKGKCFIYEKKLPWITLTNPDSRWPVLFHTHGCKMNENYE